MKINESTLDSQKRPKINYRVHHTIVIDDPFDEPKVNSPDNSPVPGSLTSEHHVEYETF